MKTIKTPLLLSIFLCFVLEIFIFNFHHWTSLIQENNISYQLTAGAGIQMNEDESFVITDEETSYFEITLDSSLVKTLYMNMSRIEDGTSLPVALRIEATDEGSSVPYPLPEITIYPEIVQSQYIHLNLSGSTSRLLIYFNENWGTKIQLNQLSLNPIEPLHFSWYRFIASLLILAAIYILYPKNGFYRFLCDSKSHRQRFILLLYACVQIALFFFLIREANYSVDPNGSPYPSLAKALAEGRFYLDIEPSPSLLAMDNPYDTLLREQQNVSFLWDYAYYNGHYYVYFGITPVLLFYLPYYLLTGQAFHVQGIFYVCAILLTLGCLLLLWKLVTRYFKKTPFLVYLLLAAAFINGFGAFYLFAHPKFYSEPNLLALTLAVWGLYFWLQADISAGLRRNLFFFAGSLCIALIAGCRPQMLLLCFLSIPLFAGFFIQKKNLPSFAIFMLPFIAFGIFIMYYNYARFGSIFDFGANYNLTSNDMTQRGFVLGRIPLGLFSYLFQPVQLSSQFPYIEELTVQTSYMGITISEGIYGGLFFSTPLAAAAFFLPSMKKRLQTRKLWAFCLLSVLFGFVLVILDTEMAGILPRYYSDFSLFFLIPAVIFVLALCEETYESPYRSRWLSLISVLCLIGLIYQFFMIFADNDTNLNYVLFNKVGYLIQFWK